MYRTSKLLVGTVFLSIIASTSAVSAQCSKAATKALLNSVEDALFVERKLLWSAATNPNDDKARRAYLGQWGALGSGQGGKKADYFVKQPEGARTALNDTWIGLREYLMSCTK